MSVADQQMVQIARALCLGADILIFDEPTACLTLKETEKLLSIIRKFKEEGNQFFVSHHLDEVIEISDRVSIMRDGALIENLGKGELSVTRLINGMIGREADKGRNPAQRGQYGRGDIEGRASEPEAGISGYQL